MVGVAGLQGSDERLEAGMAAEVLEAGVLEEEGPAGEAGVHTALQPVEGGIEAVEEGEDTGELVTGVMGMAEGLGIGAGALKALQGGGAVAAAGVHHAFEAGDERSESVV